MQNYIILFATANETIRSWVEIFISGIEALAVVILVISIVVATIIFLKEKLFSGKEIHAYQKYRSNLARAILLGLEILIAADVIRTVILDRTLEAVAVLGLLVALRIVLSWSLLVEIESRWPWQPKVENDVSTDIKSKNVPPNTELKDENHSSLTKEE